MQSLDDLREQHALVGAPRAALSATTLAFGAGLSSIVLYGVAGPEFMDWLGLSATSLGVLLASPHLSKALLRIPFGAWVDAVGGRIPFLWLLALNVVGLAGVVTVLALRYPDGSTEGVFPVLLVCGVLAGAGGATFSVGVPQTSYWFPASRQGLVLGIYAGAGNVTPGVLNYLVPVLITFVGLTAAYAVWLALLVGAVVVYARYAVDAYHFQLVAQGLDPDAAADVARRFGQDVTPSGSTWTSLRTSATNRSTWYLVFLYTVSFGGGFTALTAWFPTYWHEFHGMDLMTAGLASATFTVFGSVIRIPGGSLADRFGGENVGLASFLVMALGAAVLMTSISSLSAFLGMMTLATGMGVANAAVFKLVPAYVPEAVGGASGWIGGVGGAGTLVVVPALGMFVDELGQIGYARGFVLFVVLSGLCVLVSYVLKARARGRGRVVEGVFRS